MTTSERLLLARWARITHPTYGRATKQEIRDIYAQAAEEERIGLR